MKHLLSSTLLITLLSIGCAPAHREIRSLQSAGLIDEAAHAALRARREDPDSARIARLAAGSLEEVTQQRMIAAAELSEAGEWADAIAALDRLRVLLERGESLGVPVALADIAAMRAELVEGAIQWGVARAGEAIEAQSWGGAVARLEQCEQLQPGRQDVRELLLAARRGWAADSLAAGQPRDAATRLARSAAMGSAEDAEQAAGILEALGGEALTQGACRAAAADLEQARSLRSGPLTPPLEQARRCARTGVQLSGFPAAAESALVAVLQDRGTDHLQIGGTGARTIPGPDGIPVQTGPYRITIQPAAPRLRPQAPYLQTHRIPLTTDCRDPYGVRWPGDCVPGAMVTYEELVEHIDGELSAVLIIEDLRTDPPLLITRQPVRVTGQEAARWRGDVLMISGSSTAWVSGGRSVTRAAPARIEARERLTAGLSATLSQRLAQEILATLDLEPAPTPGQGG